MHEHIMTDADQNKADAIKNEILDLCLARKVSALVALSASRCAAECFESIIKEQGGQVFEVNGNSDSARRAAEATVNAIIDEFESVLLVPDGFTAKGFYGKRWTDIALKHAAPTDNDAESLGVRFCWVCRSNHRLIASECRAMDGIA